MKMKFLFFTSFLLAMQFQIAQAEYLEVDRSYHSGEAVRIVNSATGSLVSIASANSVGVSYNRLSKIAMSGGSVKILNAASLNSNLQSNSESNIVVLDIQQASGEVRLKGVIEIVGKPAEIVINSGANQKLILDACEFVGVQRVVLATGAILINQNSGELDRINIVQGSIEVDDGGLYARGATFLDVLSQTVSVDGVVTTNLRAAASGNGYAVASDGNLEASFGHVRLMVGNNSYKFAEAAIDQALADNSSHSYYFGNKGSQIRSGSILIESTDAFSQVNVNQVLSTKGDLVMASMYKGQNIVPDEKIVVRAKGPSSNVQVTGNLVTASEISMESNGRLGVGDEIDSEQTIFAANTINFAARDQLVNHALLRGKNVYVAAGSLVNEGSLMVEDKVYVSGEQKILNQFGGIISANDIVLKSSGPVINGALRPYKLGFKFIAQALTTGSIYEGGTYTDLQDDPANSYQIFVNNLSAAIIGNNVEIQSGEFVNVNPYYILHGNNFENSLAPVLDPEKSEQVMLVAESSLVVTSKAKIVNSSAVIQANSGKLVLSAPSILNQRYRIQVNAIPGAELPPNLCVEYNGCMLADNQKVTINTASQYIHFYSPAGRIYGGSDAIVVAEDSLKNEMSFIEVFGDLDVSVNSIEQLGFKLQQVYSVTVTTQHRKKYCDKKVAGQCVNHKTKRWNTDERSLHQVEVGQLPALFSVAGFLAGNGSGNISLTTLQIGQ
ncbi:MAG: hypothetical protein HPY82_22365 [Gammaproteobacteria bacterium]|nr:hypothetical protein [Gammaproteobacteria bacterium]